MKLNRAVLALSLAGSLLSPMTNAASADWPIIVRRGDQLFEGAKPFRFFGLAAPNIQANENQLLPDYSNRFPDEFELRDILSGLQRVGGRATRTFSLSVFHPDDKGVPAHFSARRVYNEDAFRCLDRLVSLCPEYDVRLIIPFIASQSFGNVRGVDEFAKLSGKPGAAFWTDPEVKEDFKHFLTTLLNRKNTLTGVLYKDDPAILAWQLGNEFGSYAGDRKLNAKEYEGVILTWSLEMAKFLKEQDPNHLVMEAGGCDREELIKSPYVDVMSDHLYEYWNKQAGRPWELGPLAAQSWQQCQGRKVLMIDEFGLGTVENQRELMRVIREDTKIAGGLLWSIRAHRRDGGWYYHWEYGTDVHSFHVPGFSGAGFLYEETRMLDLLRKEAYAIRGLPLPPIAKPAPAPVLFRQGDGFTWRGSMGASSYVIERAAAATGPWTVIARDLEDSVISNVKEWEVSPAASFPVVLYYDENAPAGTTAYYRIKGVNLAGETDYSPVLTVTTK